MTQPAATPAGDVREGPAFPLAVKLLATALVAATLYWGLAARGSMAATDWTATAIGVTGGAVLLVLWCLSWMWRSRTRVDAWGIRQTWMWDKRVAWADMGQARLIGVPGLSWLFAPRLVARVRGVGGIVVFHCAEPAVLEVVAFFVTTGVPPQALQPQAPGHEPQAPGAPRDN